MALLFNILHTYKRLNGSTMSVNHGDVVTAWFYVPVISGGAEDMPRSGLMSQVVT